MDGGGRAAALALAMAAGLACSVAQPVTARADDTLPWVVYYGETAPEALLEPYDVIVLDSDGHPPVGPLRERGKTVLGYLALAEIDEHRPYFPAAREAGLLLEPNPDWPGAHLVDVRKPAWTRMVLEEIVPRILHDGFRGLFLDTADSADDLEQSDPKRYAGMRTATARLVLAIHRHYPTAPLMLNRGFAIVPEAGAALDYLLGESVLSTFEGDPPTYRDVDADGRKWQIDRLDEARALFPRLRIMTLDYWDPTDLPGLRRLYAEERARGFSPYVATKDLQSIVPEPAP